MQSYIKYTVHNKTHMYVENWTYKKNNSNLLKNNARYKIM